MTLFVRTASVIACIGALAASHAGAQELDRFTIHQDLPVLGHVDVGAPGRSHGDILAFEAALTGEDGSTGTLSGILITVDLPGDGEDVFEDRLGQLVFDFGEGSKILAAGDSVYAEDKHEMSADQPQIRAVIGGTGRYIGARGQLTTTRNGDGSYEHEFELIQ